MPSRRNKGGSSIGDIIKWGAIAFGAYWVYQNFFAASTTAASTTTTTPATTTTTTPATPTVAFNSLDAIYGRILAAAKADNVTTQSPYHWNVYLVNSGGPANIDLGAVFPGVDLTLDMTSAQYWAGMAAYLATTKGMTGLGLYGGLSAVYRRRYA